MTTPTPDAALTEEQVARVQRFLDERSRPMPFAPKGFLPEDVLSVLTRTGDRLLASDILALLADRARLTERLAEVEAERDDACRGEEAWVAHHDREHRWHMEALARAEAAEARETALREAAEALADEMQGAGVFSATEWPSGWAARVRALAEHATPSDPPQGERERLRAVVERVRALAEPPRSGGWPLVSGRDILAALAGTGAQGEAGEGRG